MTYEETVKLWKNGKIADGKNIAVLLSDFASLFKENSIDSKECENSSDGWKFLLETLGKREELSEDLIKDFHFELNDGSYTSELASKGETAGEYKKNDSGFGSFPEDVPFEMNDLIEEIEDAEEEGAIASGAYIISQFEAVQPFAAGNRITSEFLMNYILLKNNHPPVCIFSDDKDRFSDALSQWCDEDELKPMINFLKFETAKTWDNLLE